MRRNTATVGFAFSLIVMLAAQISFLTRKIQPADVALYARHGIELARTAKWRYGYLPSMHGAFLVKVPITEPEAKEPPRGTELTSLMSAELRSVPLKFAFEMIFYIFLLVYVFFLAPRLSAALRNREGRRLSRFFSKLLPGALFFVLVAAPLLIWGYGYGGFTNLVGPDAMSYSGPYFHLQMWLHNSSNSISYRAFVSPLMLPVGVFVDLVWEGLQKLPVFGELLDSEPATAAPYWAAGALVYGLVGLTLSRTSRLITARQRGTHA